MRRFLFIFLFAILLFCFGAPRARSITLVQKVSASAGNTTNPVSFPNANTAGNLIIVAASWLNCGTASVSDSVGNSYVSAVGPTTNAGSSQIWYAANIAAASTNTVTASFSCWNNSTVSIFEYSGLATSSPLDVTAANTGNSTSLSVGPVTTTQANELIFATGYGNSGGTLTADPSYIMEQYSTWQGTHLGVEDRTVAATGTYNATFSDTAAWTWQAQIATFKAATSSAGLPTCGIHGDSTGHMPTDWTTFTPPTSPNGGEGATYNDSTFGCTVTRLTNGVYDAANGDASWNNLFLSMTHDYSTLSPINATDTLVNIGSGDGARRIKDISGNLVVPKGNMPAMDGSHILWDASNGSVFYYTNGNSLMKGTITGTAPNATVSTTTLHTFTQYPAINFMDAADVSQDGQHVVIVGGTPWNTSTAPFCYTNDLSGCTGESVFVYNVITNPGTAESTPGVYTTTCKGWMSGPNNNCLHKLHITPENYALIDFTNDGTGAEQGYRLWTGATPLPHIQDFTNHLDVGQDLNGNSVFIADGSPNTLSGDSNPCPSGTNSFVGVDVQLLSNPQSETCLFDNAPSWHVSYRGNLQQPWVLLSFDDQDAGVPGPQWFTTSVNAQTNPDNSVTVLDASCNQQRPYTQYGTGFHCYSDPTTSTWALYADELVAVRIDAGNNSNSMYRLAHAYSRTNEDFGAQLRGAISRDGKYVIFDSNMAHPGGCPSGAYVAYSCSDVYLIKIQ